MAEAPMFDLFFSNMQEVIDLGKDDKLSFTTEETIFNIINKLIKLIDYSDPRYLGVREQIRNTLEYAKISAYIDSLVNIMREIRLNRPVHKWCTDQKMAISYSVKLDAIRQGLRIVTLEFVRSATMKRPDEGRDQLVCLKDRCRVVTDDLGGILWQIFARHDLKVVTNVPEETIILLQQIKVRIRRGVIQEMKLDDFSSRNVGGNMWKRADLFSDVDAVLEAAPSNKCVYCEDVSFTKDSNFGIVDCCDHLYCLSCLNDNFTNILDG